MGNPADQQPGQQPDTAGGEGEMPVEGEGASGRQTAITCAASVGLLALGGVAGYKGGHLDNTLNKIGLGKYAKNYRPPPRHGRNRAQIDPKTGKQIPQKRRNTPPPIPEPKNNKDLALLAVRPVTETIDMALTPLNKVAGTDINLTKYNPAHKFRVTEGGYLSKKFGAYMLGWGAVTTAVGYMLYRFSRPLKTYIFGTTTAEDAKKIKEDAEKALLKNKEGFDKHKQSMANDKKAKEYREKEVKLAGSLEALLKEKEELEKKDPKDQDKKKIAELAKQAFAKKAELLKHQGNWRERIWRWFERIVIGGAIVGTAAAVFWFAGGAKFMPQSFSCGAIMSSGSAIVGFCMSGIYRCFGWFQGLFTSSPGLPAP